jgi:hypothetical protein
VQPPGRNDRKNDYPSSSAENNTPNKIFNPEKIFSGDETRKVNQRTFTVESEKSKVENSKLPDSESCETSDFLQDIADVD